jgi:hypothetical protein
LQIANVTGAGANLNFSLTLRETARTAAQGEAGQPQALGDTAPSWFQADVTTGTGILPGETVDVTITFDASALGAGQYDGEIVIDSNDLSQPTIHVPVSLTVLQTQAYIFYNNSAWDGNKPEANAADDNAIAVDKMPLRSGAKATFANYTSYNLGINGIMIDLALPGPVPTLSATDDFTFRVGNSADPSTWAAPSDRPAISIRPGAGLAGSDRVTLIWPDGLIKKQWLQVTVLPTDHTGLSTQDVFYFGNAIGECGNTSGNTTPDAVVNGADVVYTRSNLRGPFNPAPITFPYDYNRDKIVNGADIIISRVNLAGPFSTLKLITAP